MGGENTMKEIGPHTVTREVVPGIVRDARQLGVSRFHLWAVLRGHRQSPRLVQRYQRLRARRTA